LFTFSGDVVDTVAKVDVEAVGGDDYDEIAIESLIFPQ